MLWSLVLLHVQDNNVTPTQISLSPHSSTIMSCAHTAKQQTVVCQSCVARVDSRVCHGSWRMLVMPLRRRRTMKWVESQMKKKKECQTAHVTLTLNSLWLCSENLHHFNVFYISALQCCHIHIYHHVVNKMHNDEGILPGEIFTSVTDGGFVLALFYSALGTFSFSPLFPFLPQMPPCICSSIIPLSFASGKKQSFSVTNMESLLGFSHLLIPWKHLFRSWL